MFADQNPEFVDQEAVFVDQEAVFADQEIPVDPPPPEHPQRGVARDLLIREHGATDGAAGKA